MTKILSTPPAGEGAPAVSPRRAARALAEYEQTQARIKAMLEEHRRERPIATEVAPTRTALQFTARERSEMCAAYYNQVPIRRIAEMFGTTPATIRAIVKMALMAMAVCLWCVMEEAPNGIELIDLPLPLFG